MLQRPVPFQGTLTESSSQNCIAPKGLRNLLNKNKKMKNISEASSASHCCRQRRVADNRIANYLHYLNVIAIIQSGNFFGLLNEGRLWPFGQRCLECQICLLGHSCPSGQSFFFTIAIPLPILVRIINGKCVHVSTFYQQYQFCVCCLNTWGANNWQSDC